MPPQGHLNKNLLGVGGIPPKIYTAAMPSFAPEQPLPAGTSAWVLASGKIGHEVHCLGIARALGLEPIVKPVRPRRLFEALSPYGPVDPRDSAHRPGSLLAPPFPDIAFAAGRSTIPYLRHLRQASGGRTFTVILQDPRTGPRAADVIWVPAHDRLRGDNVLATLTSPHSLRPHVLAAARGAPDSRISALPHPRVGLILGGPSAHHRFEASDIATLVEAARSLVRSGHGVMVTPSRRTPPELLGAIRDALAAERAIPDRAFVWDGTGDNPYAQMLANAQALLVTGDSANMVGEALATGAPVHVYEPTGGHQKLSSFIDQLAKKGLVRRWTGALEAWTYEPVDATSVIAAEIAAT